MPSHMAMAFVGKQRLDCDRMNLPPGSRGVVVVVVVALVVVVVVVVVVAVVYTGKCDAEEEAGRPY